MAMQIPDLFGNVNLQNLMGTPGINPNAPTPQIPQQDPRWLQSLNGPLGQIGLQLLANSRNQLGQPNRLGQTAGQAVLGYQNQQRALAEDQLKRKYMEAQLAKLNGGSDTIGVINPDKYTPESVAKFKKSGNYGDLVLGDTRSSQSAQMAAYAEHVKQAAARGEEPLPIEKFLPLYTDLTTKMQPSVNTVAQVPTVVTPGRQGGRPTLNPLTTLPNVTSAAQAMQGAEASGRVAGQTSTEAQFDLPRAEANAQQALDAIKGLKQSAGASGLFGFVGSLTPVVPGTKRADAAAYLDQIKGKSFLEAYNTLRGGGQISDAEGARAVNAIARLNRNQSWESAQKALDDLQSVIESGLARAKKKTQPNQDSSVSQNTSSGPAIGSVESGYRFKGGDPSKPENWVKQ